MLMIDTAACAVHAPCGVLDFIVAKLRPVCKTCKETIATEVWCAAVEKPYCLCNECYDARQLKTKASERVVFKKTHEALGAIDDPDTKTEKSIDDFDTRQAFLQLCQLNHYQYDFLRRAKHTSAPSGRKQIPCTCSHARSLKRPSSARPIDIMSAIWRFHGTPLSPQLRTTAAR